MKSNRCLEIFPTWREKRKLRDIEKNGIFLRKLFETLLIIFRHFVIVDNQFMRVCIKPAQLHGDRYMYRPLINEYYKGNDKISVMLIRLQW